MYNSILKEFTCFTLYIVESQLVKDLSLGPEGSSNKFQETTKEQVKTEGKQNSTPKAGSQSGPEQWMAQTIKLQPYRPQLLLTKPRIRS